MAYILPQFISHTPLPLLSIQPRSKKKKTLSRKTPQVKNNIQQQQTASNYNNNRNYENKSAKMRGIKLMEFPHLLSSHKQVMVDLISAVDSRLGDYVDASSLTVPQDVEYYESSIGSSQGALSINRGRNSSPIDFILSSWLHLKLPTGGVMNITNLQGYMKPTTVIPHFQFELVQVTPVYFIFFLDLTPRKDVVLNPDYLKTFYEDTNLDSQRKQLETVVLEAKPYFSSSLYFRHVVSPTSILVGIDCKDGGSERVEGVIHKCIGPIANEVLGLWIDYCYGETYGVGGNEIEELKRRDFMIKSKAVDMDLSSSMPLQFGQDVASRVLGVIRSAFGIS